MESRARSITKAVLWQMLGLLTMSAVGFVLTGSVRVGGIMALINAGIGLTLYVAYERLWQRVRWGRIAG